MNYDIVIIGSGISGLTSAYFIKKNFPNISFIILEKYKKGWLGGRSGNDTFYGTQIVIGAGVGRKDKNPLLIKLLKDLDVPYTEFEAINTYSKKFTPVNILDVLKELKQEYKKHPELHHKTFKQFFIQLFGEKKYKQFIISTGYTDYENAALYDTLYDYGMEDNVDGWIGLDISWKKLVEKLYNVIGKEHFKFLCEVIKINPVKNDKSYSFKIMTKKNTVYYSKKVIVAADISTIQKLIPVKQNLYKQIHGQPFVRMYGKFNKESNEIMKKYVSDYTIVPGPLQKILSCDTNKGVYMIAYSDNDNVKVLKNHFKNTPQNRKFFCNLIEESLGIPNGSLTLIAIKEHYWPNGTHYYEPLSKEFSDRNEFLDEVQHPEKGILIVGEAVSTYQGWVEGALRSVKKGLTKKWILDDC